MPEPEAILAAAKSVLLVDWPDQGVPRALLEAGLVVYSHSPEGTTRPRLAGEPPALDFGEPGPLPAAVDLVHVFRPPDEHADIVAEMVVPLGARALWLQPPVTSEATAALAAEHGLDFVQGVAIGAVARELAASRR